MRIGIITHNYPRSTNDRQNAGIFVYDFAKALKKLGVNVYIYNISDILSGLGKDKKFGDLKPYNPLDLFLFIYVLMVGLKGVENFQKKNNLDFTIGMWAFPAGVFTWWLNKRYKIPYFIWALGSDIYVYSKFPIVGLFIRETLKKAKYLFADGIDLANKVKKISGKKCFFIPSASNFSNRRHSQVTKKNGKISLTFVGRMELIKGPDIFIDALIENKSKINNYVINLLGGGSLLESLKDKVIEEGISSNFNFFGNVNDKNKISKIMSQSDWLIIPSRSDSIPLVFSEGMKNGTPVIAASLPDLKYLIDKYKIGLYFKPGDKMVLASILSKLPSKKQKNIFTKNTKEVANIFNIDTSASRVLELING